MVVEASYFPAFHLAVIPDAEGPHLSFYTYPCYETNATVHVPELATM